MDGQGVQDDYVALTYCWGKARHYDMMLFGARSRAKHGQPDPVPNIEAHKAGILLSSMPKTLRDAVFVCRSLGFRYLWVDSLCIIQGDDDEWQSEHPRLSDIYLHAALVIAADSAPDMDDGFLSTRHAESKSGRVQNHKNTSECSHKAIEFCSSPLLLDEPLNKRAWSLSEAIFATRIAHFTSSEVIWECNEVRRSEYGNFQDLEKHDTDSFRVFRNDTLARRCTEADLYRKWNAVVEHFTRRQINSNFKERYKDPLKLVALARVARRFSEILTLVTGRKDAYLAGVWKADLPSGLLWTTELASISDVGIQPRRPEVRRAPSWSWASLEGPVVYGNLINFHSKCEIEEASVTRLNDLDPFGQISAGSMTIRGRIIHEVRAEFRDDTITCRGCQFVGDIQLGKDDSETTFSCLYLGSAELGGSSHAIPSIYQAILLIRRAEETSDCFERVGISSQLSKNAEIDTLLDAMSLETITIV